MSARGGVGRVTIGAALLDALTAALEQADPEQRARLRAALELDAGSTSEEPSAIVFTTTTLARQLGRSPRAIRAAISRGELRATKRGAGWLIGADAVADWTAVDGQQPARPRRGRPSSRRTSGRGPMGRALSPPARASQP